MWVLEKISNMVSKLFAWVGGVTILALMAIACVNVAMRTFGIPLKAAYEFIGFSGALTIAFSLGYAQVTRSHIGVDILTVRFPKRTQRILEAFSSFLCMILFSLVAWQSAVYATTLWERGETSESLRIIFYPLIYLVAICWGLLVLVLFIDFLRLISSKKEDSK